MYFAEVHACDEKLCAKALILKLKYSDDKLLRRKSNTIANPEYCLVILPFMDKIDINAIKRYFDAKTVTFASLDESRKITKSEPEQPYIFNEKFPILIDDQTKIFSKILFDVKQLGRSLCINTNDYLMIIKHSDIYHDIIKLRS